MVELFYYTNAWALIRILKDFKVKMSILSKSSDLRERNYFRYLVDPYNGVGETEARNNADNNTYVCFCTEPNSSGWRHLDKGYRLPNMWDTYADRHRGACLILDEIKFAKENSNLQVYPITYVAEKNFDDSWPLNKKMIHKLKNYENEHERRYISANGTQFCNIKNSLQKVLLGVDFGRDERNNYELELFEIIKNNKLKLDLFTQPLIDKTGKMIKLSNGCCLWNKMKDMTM